MHFIFHKNIVL